MTANNSHIIETLGRVLVPRCSAAEVEVQKNLASRWLVQLEAVPQLEVLVSVPMDNLHVRVFPRYLAVMNSNSLYTHRRPCVVTQSS